MNGRSQMQGRKNWVLAKEINATLSSETLVGWNWKNHFNPSLWDRMEGTWLWAQHSAQAISPRQNQGKGTLYSCVSVARGAKPDIP